MLILTGIVPIGDGLFTVSLPCTEMNPLRTPAIALRASGKREVTACC